MIMYLMFWEIVERMHRYDIPAGTFAYLLVLLKERGVERYGNSEQIEASIMIFSAKRHEKRRKCKECV